MQSLCQCNGTPAQLYFWLSPVLSRNHFTAPPPRMRSTREGAESSCCNTPSRLFTPALSRLLTKHWNNTHKLMGCIASCQGGSTALLNVGGERKPSLGCPAAPGSAPARWSWHRGLQLCHLCVPTLVLLWEQLSTCSKLRHHHPASPNPSGGLLPLVNAFLPPFHFGSPVSGDDRRQNGVQANDVLLFSCGFLECGWKQPKLQVYRAATRLPKHQRYGNLGTFHQQYFLHWQSLNTTCNEKATGLRAGLKLVSVITFLFIWGYFCYLGKKKRNKKPKHLTLN